MAETNYPKSIRNILSNTKYANSPRRLRNALLRVSDARQKTSAMLDFVRHILWICETLAEGNRCFQNAWSTLNRYVQDQTGIEEVAIARHNLYVLGIHEFQEQGIFPSKAGRKAAFAIELAIEALCADELKRLGELHDSVQQRRANVIGVANQCLEGFKHYYSANPDNRQSKSSLDAQSALRAELQWQINRILQIVGENTGET